MRDLYQVSKFSKIRTDKNGDQYFNFCGRQIPLNALMRFDTPATGKKPDDLPEFINAVFVDGLTGYLVELSQDATQIRIYK